ncbi:MAG: L,D-transpeptidase [Polyangiaceae bacterium]|nr:L,D-transpeptidase [Polyangiaceae bacterium]
MARLAAIVVAGLAGAGAGVASFAPEQVGAALRVASERVATAPAASLRSAALAIPSPALPAAPPPVSAGSSPVDAAVTAPAHPAPDGPPILVALAPETFVRESPELGSRKVGWLRAGARVVRGAEPVPGSGCPGSWYRIAPAGFVCAGRGATTDLDHPIARAVTVAPDRAAPLPYRYGLSRSPPPPLYVRVPTRAQRAAHEPGNPARDPQAERWWRDVTVTEVPMAFASDRPGMSIHGYEHARSSVYTGRALPRSGFAFLTYFTADGQRFGLTPELAVLPLDRLRPVVASRFVGLALGGATTLPVGFVRGRGVRTLVGDPTTVGLRPGRALEPREAVPLGAERRQVGSVDYRRTADGAWLRSDQLVVIEPRRARPAWATGDRTWLDVSVLQQTLVAYRGATPVYVTLVSTGSGGLGDPEKTPSTPRGEFLVHTKHVTATMSGDEVGDEYDLRDVPWVQYFHGGYALHAAYWHDAFGTPRSHGCINLSPGDARWLFHFTEPSVPLAWHGAMSRSENTLVHVRP